MMKTPMFIAALFTVAWTWKPTRCPLADEWIKKFFWNSLAFSMMKQMLAI